MSDKVIGKSDLIRMVYEKNRTDVASLAAASRIVDSVFDTITERLVEGERVVYTGFGAFDVNDRKERQARNLHTGETIQVPARKAPVFRAGQRLKNAVDK